MLIWRTGLSLLGARAGGLICDACIKLSFLMECIGPTFVTSQGERVPRGMGIKYSRTNI